MDLYNKPNAVLRKWSFVHFQIHEIRRIAVGQFLCIGVILMNEHLPPDRSMLYLAISSESPFKFINLKTKICVSSAYLCNANPTTSLELIFHIIFSVVESRDVLSLYFSGPANIGPMSTNVNHFYCP